MTAVARPAPAALARMIALGVPAALLAGAYLSQYVGGLAPVRNVLLAALAAFRGGRARRAWPSCSPRRPAMPAC